MNLLIDPLVSFDLIDREQANMHLVAWAHQHGPLNRPCFKSPIDFGLRQRGELVAVVCADTLIRKTQGFDRSQAFEISRVCGAAPGLSFTAVRLWRHFAYPAIVATWGTPWVISYHDATRHAGALYRRLGFALIGYSTGGADRRAVDGTVTARKRLIWAWTSEKDQLLDRRERAKRERADWPAWAQRAAREAV